AFYYTNTLHQRREGVPARPDVVSPRASSSLRAPWFEVSCCPPNVARTLASLAAYIATTDADGIQLHQYAPSTIRTELASLTVETAYPHDGVIRVRVDATSDGEWTLTMRVPSWAQGATVCVEPVSGPPSTSPATGDAVSVRRAFQAGDVVELRLPLSPPLSTPDPRIDAVQHCVVA